MKEVRAINEHESLNVKTSEKPPQTIKTFGMILPIFGSTNLSYFRMVCFSSFVKTGGSVSLAILNSAYIPREYYLIAGQLAGIKAGKL